MDRVKVAYLCGVVHGDGWISSETIGLRVCDRDFAERFRDFLAAESGRKISVNFVRGRYWEVRTGNRLGTFFYIRNFIPKNNTEKVAWLRGMFDSEGHTSNRRVKHLPNSYTRQVSFFSTCLKTLGIVDDFLSALKIQTRGIQKQGCGPGHKGKKQVYAVHLRCSQPNYARFTQLVGSSIERKRIALRQICENYCQDLKAVTLRMQAIGAENKRVRRETKTIPAVLSAYRNKIRRGLSMTLESCRKEVAGVESVRAHIRHTELVRRARELP